MMSANASNKVRRAVYRRDGFRCALCDSTNGLQIHHIIPRSHGGPNLPGNMITLCWKCHAAAHGTRHPDYPEYITAEYIQQAAVEYISDYYAEVYGVPWNPWEKELVCGSCHWRGKCKRRERELGTCDHWSATVEAERYNRP